MGTRRQITVQKFCVGNTHWQVGRYLVNEAWILLATQFEKDAQNSTLHANSFRHTNYHSYLQFLYYLAEMKDPLRTRHDNVE